MFKPAAAAGYKPAPQLTRPPIRQINFLLTYELAALIVQ